MVAVRALLNENDHVIRFLADIHNLPTIDSGPGNNTLNREWLIIRVAVNADLHTNVNTTG